MADPEFIGQGELASLIARLYTRRARTTETPPIISLVRTQRTEESTLSAISRWLDDAMPRRVAHALWDVSQPDEVVREEPDREPLRLTPKDVSIAREVLRDLAKELSSALGGSFQLPHLDLVMSLMAVQLRELDPGKRHRELRAVLRRRAAINPDQPGVDLDAIQQMAPLLNVALTVLPPVWFWLRFSGRIPLVSGPYRWLLRQPHIVPEEHDRSLAGIAERLTMTRWERESEQVIQLLTGALIQDLRRAYRPRWFRRYRTTHPIVLLNNVSRANGGYTVLRAVNDVRNVTGLNDPLLLISESDKIPPFANRPDAEQTEQTVAHRTTDVDTIYRQWQNDVTPRRRRRESKTWYLVLLLPADALRQRAETNQAQPQHRNGRAPFPPVTWQRSQPAAVTLTILLLLFPLLGYAQWSRVHCGDGLTWPGLSPQTEMLDGECVGVTEDLFDFVSDREFFGALRSVILEQNAAVDRLRTESQRPFITITYLGTLTSTSNSAETLTAEREELAGLAVAQQRQIQTDAAFEPLVKVLIANGGERMLHGERVAATLGKLAESDRSVVGVVGLNESREPTLRTIRALAQKGLPVVAAPLSADVLADSNSLFYQIAPQNRRQAEVAAAYAANRRDNGASPTGAQIESAARIYVSDDATDIYGQNLASDLQISLVAKGFTTELVNFTPSGAPRGNPNGSRSVDNANVAGRDSCGYGGVVFTWAAQCRISRAISRA